MFIDEKQTFWAETCCFGASCLAGFALSFMRLIFNKSGMLVR
jgi:hypothetical protein